jgi:hypothetical protein
MADKGYSVKKIHDRLDFPLPMEKVRELVWKHYLETGVILEEEPGNSADGFDTEGTGEKSSKAIFKETRKDRITYVKVQDEYGRSSFKQVVEKVEEKPGEASVSGTMEYVAIDFGKRLYRDKKGFEKALECLNKDDREYILGLPWPLKTVWHVKDERMVRIMGKIAKQSDL